MYIFHLYIFFFFRENFEILCTIISRIIENIFSLSLEKCYFVSFNESLKDNKLIIYINYELFLLGFIQLFIYFNLL